MRAVEEFQPAEFHVRHVAAGQFRLELDGMAGGAEQHRLILELHARLAVLEDAVHHVARLLGLGLDRHQPRLFRRGPLGPEVLGEPLFRQSDHGIRRGKDRLGRAIISVQSDDIGTRREAIGKVEDVAHGRGPEGIDRLGIVTHHGQPATIRLQRHQDARLQPVGVLIFVDQHMIPGGADMSRQNPDRP